MKMSNSTITRPLRLLVAIITASQLLVVSNNNNNCCHGFAAVPSLAFQKQRVATSTARNAISSSRSHPILEPSFDNENAFDYGCVANPVILPPSGNVKEWQCYYYGNAGSWNGGHPCFLPTGSSGLAVSSDGISGWTKVPGNEAGGAILVPSDTTTTTTTTAAWDSVQTGVADVVRITDEELHMYYFGGSDEEITMGPGSIVGFRMRIGRAKSFDNGRSWVKDDTYCLDYDESEGLFASWPRIVVSDNDNSWQMFYHSFDGKKWRVFGAESTDKGDSWTRTGLVLEGGSSEEEDFDFAGIGTRAVTPWRDGLLMIYEGVDKSSTHRLGAAYYGSDESSGGKKSWTKLNNGEPILAPGTGPLGEWTKQVIGTPYVVNMPDGSLRVYHCAKDGPSGKMAIGVVESKSGDVLPDCWSAVEQ